MSPPLQHRIPLLPLAFTDNVDYPLPYYNFSTLDPVLCFAQFSFPTPRPYFPSLFCFKLPSRPPTDRLAFPGAQTLAFFTLSIYPDLCSSLVITAPLQHPFARNGQSLFALEEQERPLWNASPRPPPQATEKGNMRTSELGAVRVLKFIGSVRSRLRLSVALIPAQDFSNFALFFLPTPARRVLSSPSFTTSFKKRTFSREKGFAK